MPFPLPLDPEFRKEVVQLWLEDGEERVNTRVLGAEESWRTALRIYLSLPAGEGSEEIENALGKLRGKLDQFDESEV
jgi:hypothetical protein